MTWRTVVVPLLVAGGGTVAALLVRRFLLGRLDRVVGPEAAGLVRAAVRVPSLLWCLVVGLYAGLEGAVLPPRQTARVELWLQALIIASVAISGANALGLLVGRSSEHHTLGVGVTGLAQTTVRITLLLVGGLILLGHLGIAITPILTALGVGGLAVALALQDTLSNLFAGLHLLADQPIRVGDFVRLEGGLEGFVQDIGWRSTRIRLLANNLVVVPNANLAQSTITNYSLPEARMSLLIPVSVGYGEDAGRVEQVLVDETARATADIAGLLADPAPFVRFIPGFGESSLDFTLICQVATAVDQYLVQHELRKRILRRFRAEGIEIPFPIRTVELRARAASRPGVGNGSIPDGREPGR